MIEIFCDNKGKILSLVDSLSIFFIIDGNNILSVSPSIKIALSAKNNSERLKLRYFFTKWNALVSFSYSFAKFSNFLELTSPSSLLKYRISSSSLSDTICEE